MVCDVPEAAPASPTLNELVDTPLRRMDGIYDSSLSSLQKATCKDLRVLIAAFQALNGTSRVQVRTKYDQKHSAQCLRFTVQCFVRNALRRLESQPYRDPPPTAPQRPPPRPPNDDHRMQASPPIPIYPLGPIDGIYDTALSSLRRVAGEDL